MKTQKWKSYVALGFILIGTAPARADEVRDWFADHPFVSGAAVGASVAATTNAIGLTALSKAKPIPEPALALASPAGALNEAERIYNSRSESYSREISGTEDAIKNKESVIAKLRAEHEKLAGDNGPRSWKRKLDISEEINANKRGIEALKSSEAQLRIKLELATNKASEVEAYVKSGTRGRFLKEQDFKFLDPFKHRYDFAAKDFEKLTQIQAKKLAYRAEVKKFMLYGNLLGLVSVPAVGSTALIASHGIYQERREKSFKAQIQQDEAKARTEAANAAAN